MSRLELRDTIEEMISDSYEERFKAEYHQLKIRYKRLQSLIVKSEAGTLGFTLDCPIEILKEQKKFMGCYLFQLEIRAEIEGIDLNLYND